MKVYLTSILSFFGFHFVFSIMTMIIGHVALDISTPDGGFSNLTTFMIRAAAILATSHVYISLGGKMSFKAVMILSVGSLIAMAFSILLFMGVISLLYPNEFYDFYGIISGALSKSGGPALIMTFVAVILFKLITTVFLYFMILRTLFKNQA